MLAMKSTLGRPRALSDEDVAVVLCWFVQVEAWKAVYRQLKTRRDLAEQLGVSLSTIDHVIANLGTFKQPSPEQRVSTLEARHRHFAKLRELGLL
jgi:hypothetical protein